MKNYFDLCSTTPTDEKCSQVGDNNYTANSTLEASAYIDQLQRTYGEPPEGTRLQIIECPHEFGIYLDIRFHFDDDEETHLVYFDQIQRGLKIWDNLALQSLRTNGYQKPDNIRILNQRAA